MSERLLPQDEDTEASMLRRLEVLDQLDILRTHCVIDGVPYTVDEFEAKHDKIVLSTN